MAQTTVTDAIVFPQSAGTGLSANNDANSAAALALLSSYRGNEYVMEEYSDGMGFVGHDGTNDTVTIGAGACFIKDTSTSTTGSRGSGGNAQAQSSVSSGFDTEIPDNQPYLVIFPSQVTVNVDSASLNQIWVNITDVSGNNAVEVRSDGGGTPTSAPTDSFLKLGEANPDDATADARKNDEAPSDVTVASGNATLSSGVAVVSTGVTTTPSFFDVYLDPSGNGNNTADVKAAARAFWDNSAGEYKVELLEDGTSVGSPDIGYKVVQR